MAEEKRARLDTGRALFDTYQRKKHDSQGRHSDQYSAPDTESCVDDKKPFIHLDAVTLVRRKEQFDSLDLKIKTLQESLSEKDEIITSLEIQNKILREGGGDSNIMMSENEKVREMTKMLEARNTYIGQLSESLLLRSNELKTAYSREKELTLEIDKLQQEICLKTKESQAKLRDSYNENVEYKAKVNILSNRIDEYSNLVKSLKASLESNARKYDEKQEQCKKLEQEKVSASKDIQSLMKKVEEQNKLIDKKEKELTQSRTELETILANQEDILVNLKTELETKHCEDLKKVDNLYDEMMLKIIRDSGTNVSGLETCDGVKKQIDVYSATYENELKDLLARSKSTEDQLQHELKKYKDEAESYKHRVDIIASELSTEIERLKYELAMGANKYKVEMGAFKKAHDEELNRLSKLLSDSALVEGQKDVEIETYKNELKNYASCIDKLSDELNMYKQTINQQEEKILHLKDKLKHANESNDQLRASVSQYKKNETRLVHKINLTKSEIHENDSEVYKLREQIGNITDKFNNECTVITQTYEDKLNDLQKELEDSKLMYQSDISQLTSKLDKNKELIKHLQGELIKTASFNREDSDLLRSEINQLRQKLGLAIQTSNDNQIFLWELLKGLRDVKICIKNVINSDEDSSVESTTSDEIIGSMSRELLTGLLKKNLHEILELCQNLDWNMKDLPETVDAMTALSPRMVTSTPIVRQPNDTTSWMRKCVQLEKEKEIMANQLELLNANVKQMEYCLTVATEESGKFNKKCQILDMKLTEFEKLRFSENELAKENNNLKDQLKGMKEIEIKLQQEVASLNAKNIKLAEILNRNVDDLYKKVSEDCLSTEFADILTDLKDKSDESLELKSQLSTLQQSEQENKLKVANIQGKLNKLNTDHISLKNILDSKEKDLEDLKLERNKLSVENQTLHANLLMLHQKLNLFGLKSTNSVLSNCSQESDHSQQNNYKKDKSSLESDISSAEKSVDKCSQNRLQTLLMLSSGKTFDNVISKPSLDLLSIYNKNNDQLQFQDKAGGDLDYLMPTIPEEDDNHDPDSLQCQVD